MHSPASLQADAPRDAPAGPADEVFRRLSASIRERIIGQDALVDRLLIALLCDGHLLVEGAPGLAKTSAVKELAAHLEASFHRVQFTPDLLPADLTGTEVYRPQDGSFTFQRGPIFHNVVLADEVNRAPAKVQSALLEAMGERQVTVGRSTYRLPRLYLVMATQNPIEQEGTYPLPEAQLDRFLLYVRIGYRGAADTGAEPGAGEPRLLRTGTGEAGGGGKRDASPRCAPAGARPAPRPRTGALPRRARARHPRAAGLRRGSVPMDRLRREPAREHRTRPGIARHAWLKGRDYVSPEDIQSIAHDVLRHRLVLSYEAEADGIDPERVVDELIARVPVP